MQCRAYCSLKHVHSWRILEYFDGAQRECVSARVSSTLRIPTLSSVELRETSADIAGPVGAWACINTSGEGMHVHARHVGLHWTVIKPLAVARQRSEYKF